MRTDIEVDAKGVVKYDTSILREGPVNPGTLKVRKISKQSVKRIYAQVEACDFFGMNQRCADMSRSDGIATFLSVRANGKTHSVSTFLCGVARCSSICDVLCKETGACSDAPSRERGKEGTASR